ncbi:MAG: class B sortase [Oscillospiraceae bacterium]|nr:class B sortase [Candidatus Ruminococcus equi]
MKYCIKNGACSLDKKPKKTIWIILLIIFIIILILGLLFVLKSYGIIFADKTPTRAETTEEPTTIATIATQPPTERFDYPLAPEPDMSSVDFDELENINEDIYAWLYIPNTNVDLPVVQSIKDRDDFFYLSHNIYKEYQFSGAIYSEIQNSTDFSDPVTVLYGHNMINGSMFATLHKFEDEDFFNENTTMFVYTKHKLLTYLIYAAYETDDRHILNSFEPRTKEGFREFLDSTLSPRSYNCNVRDVELNTNDRILTLSTCSNTVSGNRYLVQGVLVHERTRKQAK